MKSMSLPLFALAAIALAAPSAHGFQRTFHLDDELQWAQRDYREGTNFTARGMFRESDERIGGSISNVTRRLRETEQRARTVEPLQGFVDRVRTARDRFDADWTNAVREALILEQPLRAFIATNPVLQAGLNWRMEAFERLRTELETDDKTGASDELKAFQIGLRREIGSYENLHDFEPDFRAALADLERAREELEDERAKPFDPDRALRIAREQIDAALSVIRSPGMQFVEADREMDSVRSYLDDVRQTGGRKEEVAEVEAALAEAKRQQLFAGVRFHFQEAERYLANGRPDLAKATISIAETNYLSALKDDPEFGRLSEEANEWKRIAGRKTVLRDLLTTSFSAESFRMDDGTVAARHDGRTPFDASAWKPGMQHPVVPDPGLTDVGTNTLRAVLGQSEEWHVYNAVCGLYLGSPERIPYERTGNTTVLHFPSDWDVRIDNATGAILEPTGLPPLSERDLSDLTWAEISRDRGVERWMEIISTSAASAGKRRRLTGFRLDEIRFVGDKAFVAWRQMVDPPSTDGFLRLTYWIDRRTKRIVHSGTEVHEDR